jgi:ParB-like chromosome segregation protein Spo0J
MLKQLPIDQIDRRKDARALNEAAIASLSDSIASIGLINPIRVRAKDGRWEVSAGSHRLAACERLGLVEIDCIVVSDDDLHAELSMIDENLCRNELSPSERAMQTARRKAIYEELHPEAKHGGDRKSDQVDNLSTRSFAEATATATGKDERTVRRDAERGEKVIGEVIDMITGTKLDTGTYLDKLKRLKPNEQYTAAKRDLNRIKEEEKARSQGGIARRIVKTADLPIDDEEAKERQVAALMSAWNKASAEAREEFLSRIDIPVFDRKAGAA